MTTTLRNITDYILGATAIAGAIFAYALAFTLLALPVTLIPAITETIGLWVIPATLAYYGTYYLIYRNTLGKFKL